MKTGRMKYLPRSVLEELESIKKDKGLAKDVYAFGELINYCRVGRETEKIMRFGLPFKRRRGGLM